MVVHKFHTTCSGLSDFVFKPYDAPRHAKRIATSSINVLQKRDDFKLFLSTLKDPNDEVEAMCEDDPKKKRKKEQISKEKPINIDLKIRNQFSVFLQEKWKDDAKKAADRGTLAHQLIAKALEGKLSNEEFETLSQQQKEFVFAALTIHNKYVSFGYVLLATEHRVFSKELDIAGSVDVLYYNENTKHLLIVDWKTVDKLSAVPTQRYDCAENGPFKFLPNIKQNHWLIQMLGYELIFKEIHKDNENVKRISSVVVALKNKDQVKLLPTAPYHEQMKKLLNLIKNKSIQKLTNPPIESQIMQEDLAVDDDKCQSSSSSSSPSLKQPKKKPCLPHKTSAANTDGDGAVGFDVTIKLVANRIQNLDCNKDCDALLRSLHTPSVTPTPLVYDVTTRKPLCDEDQKKQNGVLFVLSDPIRGEAPTLSLLQLQCEILRVAGYSKRCAFVDASSYTFVRSARRNGAQNDEPVFTDDLINATRHLFHHRLQDQNFKKLLNSFENIVVCGKVAARVLLDEKVALNSISTGDVKLIGGIGKHANIGVTRHPAWSFRTSNSSLPRLSFKILRDARLTLTLCKLDSYCVNVGDIANALPEHLMRSRVTDVWNLRSLHQARCATPSKFDVNARVAHRAAIFNALQARWTSAEYSTLFDQCAMGINEQFVSTWSPQGFHSLTARGVGQRPTQTKEFRRRRAWGGKKHDIMLMDLALSPAVRTASPKLRQLLASGNATKQQIFDCLAIVIHCDFLAARNSTKRIKGYRFGAKSFIRHLKKIFVWRWNRHIVNDGHLEKKQNQSGLKESYIRHLIKQSEQLTSAVTISTRKRNDSSPMYNQRYNAFFVPKQNQQPLPPSTAENLFPIARNSPRGQLKQRDRKASEAQAVLLRERFDGKPRDSAFLTIQQRVDRAYYIEHGFKALCKRYANTQRSPWSFLSALLYCESSQDSYPSFRKTIT